MPILPKKDSQKQNNKAPVFLSVCRYCIPHMAIAAAVPFILMLLSLLIRAAGAVSTAEFTALYIALPLYIAVPLFCTVKVISALKGAFPRKSNDAHKVILSVFFCFCTVTAILIALFNITCATFSAFPLDFKWAGYMRDMNASSHGAMFIFYSSVFLFYTYISLMAVTSYFIGDRSRFRFKFSLTCIVFLLIYVLFLLLLLLSYFASTFMDITALENIQISQSIFNSSMLCAFVTFDVLAIITSPLLYFINYKKLIKDPE